ncbi:hypothetical protein [Halalkalibacter hemicellulosilyticus]|uniref:Uncharacterized protein n=1 Tax=Halalkalibacter hemicellulosilyticusJCM 9152 TaxID=1236971 RepID=W4QE20_9BACI|nr:hypothetical protein [Halalkalibacter hemicellulosilyticus]GAE29604.1 hypothetical protein JCM9152_970 [Halalkalibacter hemicellulosilyticusJCM 9152]
MKKNGHIDECEKLQDELDCYIVKFPNDDMIEATVDSLRQYVPQKEAQSVSKMEKMRALISRAGKEITFIHKGFWVISCVLVLIGSYISNVAMANPLYILILLAPLPFALGLLEVFRARDKGLVEMEMACKHSVYEVILSRLFIISVYNILLMVGVTILAMPNLSHYSIWEVTLTWMTPFTWFVALALLISVHVRGAVFAPLFMTLWAMFSLFLFSQHSWVEMITHVNLVLHVVFLLVGVTLCMIQLKRMIRKYSSYERVGVGEASF